VAESNPFRLHPGETMRVRVLHEGKPVAGALVKAIAQDDPDNTMTARSGKDGRAAFRLPGKGVWLVETVQMVPAPKDTGADWESLWASLTFEVP
jgi:uncharacterized GH25 family protein